MTRAGRERLDRPNGVGLSRMRRTDDVDAGGLTSPALTGGPSFS